MILIAWKKSASKTQTLFSNFILRAFTSYKTIPSNPFTWPAFLDYSKVQMTKILANKMI